MSTWSTSRYPTGDSTLVNTSTWYGGVTTYRYDKVDETVVDDTDYIGIQSTLAKVIFSLSSFTVPDGSTVDSLTIYYRVKKNVTASAANIRVILRVGTTDHVQTGINPTTVWATTYVTYTQNPHTAAAWTAAEINGSAASGALVGFGVGSADVAPEPQLSQMYAVVHYQWTVERSFTAANCAHSHGAGSATLIQNHFLVSANALHTHASDATVVIVNLTLLCANAAHLHNSEAVTLTVQGGAGKHFAFGYILRHAMN